jgi:hypothetical protein
LARGTLPFSCCSGRALLPPAWLFKTNAWKAATVGQGMQAVAQTTMHAGALTQHWLHHQQTNVEAAGYHVHPGLHACTNACMYTGCDLGKQQEHQPILLVNALPMLPHGRLPRHERQLRPHVLPTALQACKVQALPPSPVPTSLTCCCVTGSGSPSTIQSTPSEQGGVVREPL